MYVYLLSEACSCTCVIVSRGRGQLEGDRRLHSSSDALQQGEERVPVVCTVDVGCVRLQQLVKAISHLPADPGEDMRLHHQQEAEGEKDLWAHSERAQFKPGVGNPGHERLADGTTVAGLAVGHFSSIFNVPMIYLFIYL